MVSVRLYSLALAIAITSFALNLAALFSPSWIIYNSPKASPIHLKTSYGLFQKCDTTTLPYGVGKNEDTQCRSFPSRTLDCAGLPPHKLRFGVSRVDTDDILDDEAVKNMPFGWDRVRKDQARRVAQRQREAARALVMAQKNSPTGSSGDDEDNDDVVWTFCDSWITAGYVTQLSLIFTPIAAISTALILLPNSRLKRDTGWKLVGGLLSLNVLFTLTGWSLVLGEFSNDVKFDVGCRLGKSFILSTISWSLSFIAATSLLVIGSGVNVPGFGWASEQDGYERIADGEDHEET
ncbi:hypothetical protein T439DRAFT_69331 [Meredithblackwellia eburnea MCA 4105]